MQQSGRLIRTTNVNFTDVAIDKRVFREAVADMSQNAGALLPTPNWITLEAKEDSAADSRILLERTFSDTGFEEKFASMDKLMDAWIGSVHRTPLNGYYKRRYGRLLNQFDPLQLWTTNVSDESVAATLMNSDLGTILDLNLLYSFAPPGDVEPTRILEVGGGYGRLAEGAFNVFGDTIRYVLVDSVPGSLCYASEYLRRACPSVKVGSYYHGDAFDLEQFHCYVVPSWHFERLNNFSYDISVNIESFQEMSQTHVDHYLRLFNNVARQNGLIYVSNARDYVFKGHWNYPENWQNVLFTNTPRSWTDDHPTEVYIKRSGDFRKANDCLRVFYEQSGVPRRLRTSVQATRELMTQSTIRVAEGWVRGLRGLLPGTK